jgi:hypothetical protein
LVARDAINEQQHTTTGRPILEHAAGER